MQDIKTLIKNIVKQACILKDKHTDEKNALVNYACIFSQNKQEYEELLEAANKIGTIIKQTPTGPLFKVQIETDSGKLQLLKIRIHDPTRSERGDADFTVSNYQDFKKKHSDLKLITRENFEMIELMDPEFNVRVYFSNPPQDVLFEKNL